MIPDQKRLLYMPPPPEEISGALFEEQTVDLFASVLVRRAGTSRPTDIKDGEVWGRVIDAKKRINYYLWRDWHGNGDGVLQAGEMTSSVTLGDPEIAATSLAVKTSHDKAVEGVTAAAAANTAAVAAHNAAAVAQTTADKAVVDAGKAQTTADAAVSSVSVVAGFAPGMIAMYANTAPPAGFLVCNGSSLATTSYPKLFSAIGYIYGGGGSVFNLPDYRGYFLRGLGGNSAGMGVHQGDAMQNITGSFGSHVFGWRGCYGSGVFQGYQTGDRGGAGDSNGGGVNFDASRQARTANENRPVNKAVLVCIKY